MSQTTNTIYKSCNKIWEDSKHRRLCNGPHKWQLYSATLRPLNKSASASLAEMSSMRPQSHFQNKYYQLPVSSAKAPTVRGSHCADFLKFKQSPPTHCASLWQWQCSWKLIWGANQWVKLCGCWEPPQNVFHFCQFLLWNHTVLLSHPLETKN